ncbi:MAG: hypothetical protein OXC40_05290 [Proteobacteria bacterium]|nr:hypothetical protein [Pseudomonadota bacterium]
MASCGFGIVNTFAYLVFFMRCSMRWLLFFLIFFISQQSFAYDDIEGLNISLSDIEDIEDEVLSVFLSGSHESIDLDILSKAGPFELAINPVKGSIYAEVDFMALARNNHSDRDLDKLNENNAKIALVSLIVLGAIIAYSYSPEAIANREKARRAEAKLICYPVDGKYYNCTKDND